MSSAMLQPQGPGKFPNGVGIFPAYQNYRILDSANFSPGHFYLTGFLEYSIDSDARGTAIIAFSEKQLDVICRRLAQSSSRPKSFPGRSTTHARPSFLLILKGSSGVGSLSQISIPYRQSDLAAQYCCRPFSAD